MSKTFGTLRFIEGGASDSGFDRPVWAIEGSPDMILRLKRIFPQANKHRRGAITLTATAEVARDLEWVLERWPLEQSADDWDRMVAGAVEHRSREEAVLAILTGDQPRLEFACELARDPRDYQLVAADLALSTGGLLLADDLGLGKSMSGLLVLRDPSALPALIVCPTHLPRQWEGELAKTLPFLRAHVIRSMSVYEPRNRRGMHGHDPDVLIVGYSKLRGWGDHLAGQVRTVIFDECQELRRAEGSDGQLTGKYAAAARIADAASLRMGLSATPIYNYGNEIHNVLSVLAPDRLGTREEFAREWGAGGAWSDKLTVKDPRALGTYLRDQGLMLRRTRKEVGRELPDVVRVPHEVDSDEETYERLAADAIGLAELIVTNAGTQEERFQARGEIDWQLRRATGIAKAPYVAGFVRMVLDAEQRVVLLGWHRSVYDIWLEQLAEFNPVMYTGTESPTQKQRSIDAFLAPAEVESDDGPVPNPEASRVLILSLRSGAGLDGLQEVAHVCVFGELDWSPGMHDQCIGRLHRDGQDEAVVAYFLTSDHGSDPVMAEVLNLKRMQSEPLRDPDAALFEQSTDGSDRIRRLAEDVLRKHQRAGRLAA